MRKTVLIFGHNYATQFIDIYNQYTRLFAEDEYEVTVAYLTGKRDAEVIQRTLAENIIFLDLPKKHIRTLKIRAIQTMLKLCREKKFTIVICHRYKPAYIMLWAAQFYKIPALIMVMHELKTIASLGRKLLIALLMRRNMQLAGVSNAVRDDMRKSLWFLPKERITTLYNMIDIDLTEPQLLSRDKARQLLNINDNDFIFGNIARLAHNKDQQSLIEAFYIIKSACKQAKLIIMGDGELESTLKQQVIKLGLEKEIIFTGFIPNGFRYMTAFDCFVLSSTQEAFGRVLLEAMVAKRPVIATRVHGIPEVLGNTGALINAKNVRELADAMQKVYEQSPNEREQLGETAYQRAKNFFSIPKFFEQFWQLKLTQQTRKV